MLFLKADGFDFFHDSAWVTDGDFIKLAPVKLANENAIGRVTGLDIKVMKRLPVLAHGHYLTISKLTFANARIISAHELG